MRPHNANPFGFDKEKTVSVLGLQYGVYIEKLNLMVFWVRFLERMGEITQGELLNLIDGKAPILIFLPRAVQRSELMIPIKEV